MMMTGEQVAAKDIACLAGVKPPAVSNWRQRHAQTFPKPEWHDGQEWFSAAEVAEWLDDRTIAKSDLKDGELAGVTYGTRFRQGLGMPVSETRTTQDALWQALDRQRGHIDIQLHADLVLGLLYLCVTDRIRWSDLVAATESQQRSGIGLFVEQAMNAHGLPFPHLRSMTSAELTRSGEHELVAATVLLLDRLRRSVESGRSQSAPEWAAQAFEYLLARFAAAEGKRGAEFFTPPSVIHALVESVRPASGESIHDPCCNSGGILVEAAKRVAGRTGHRPDISLSGRALTERSWCLAKMNLELSGLVADLGEVSCLAVREDPGPGRSFDVVMMNPPFNMSDWSIGDPKQDKRWLYGPPPEHNANFAWLQHALWPLADGGRAAVLMGNGASSSENAQEKKIRAAMIEDGVIEGLIALPPQLFYSTAVSVTIWLLRKNTRARDGKILFIDATALGTMVDRIHRVLGAEDILQIADACEQWRGRQETGGYEDVRGFSASAPVQRIRENDYRLNPRAYVTAPVDVFAAAKTMLELRRALDQLDARSVDVDVTAARQLDRIDSWKR